MKNITQPWPILLLAVLLVRPTAASVVFSEIMYHPTEGSDGTDGEEFEYIELYNNGSSPETLTGASFTKGITYSFSNLVSTVLNPGEYLVVVKNRTAFQSRYPGVTNLAPGSYSGKLDNSGEKVTLKVGDTSVSVTYGTTNVWPTAADGFGPSLERYCMTASGDNAANWSACCAPTNWQQVAWTGRFDSASIRLAFFLDYDGKCLLDNVSVKALGSGIELLNNGTFESGLTGWSVTNNHALSRIEAGLGADGGTALAIQCNESRWYLDAYPFSLTFYGDAGSNRVASAPVTVVPGQDYVVTWQARRMGIGGKLFCVMGNRTNSLALGLMGTPGRANTVSANSLPIAITNVDQTYTVCPVSTANVVRAKVSSPTEVSQVELFYQIIGTNQFRYTNGSYARATMRDDGLAPDTTAGDGIYAVTLPAVITNMSLVRYHVVATATNGFQAWSPRFDDPSTDFGYWVQSTSPQTNLPNWHLLMDGAPLIYPVSRHLCAVSPDGQIFTDILAKHRGNPDNPNLDHSGIGLHFHRCKKYNAWFSPNQEGINIRHRMNNIFYYYRRVVAEPLAYDLQRIIGLPAPQLRFICAWINGFPTITTELESPDETFLTENGISSSDYVSRQSYSEGREQVGGDETLDNFDSVQNGLYGLTDANRNEFIRTNLCYESIQHSLALLSVTGNGDQDFDWNMMQHRAAADGRWRQYPWDADMSFDLTYTNAWTSLVNLHPYYKTPLHPCIWNASASTPLGLSLFYPEGNDTTTLPYRYRQQTTLARYCATLFTTNLLFSKLDAIRATLTPAYQQITAYCYAGNSLNALSNEVNNVKNFIVSRRDYLINGDWSDKMSNVWTLASVYSPSNIAVSEIMHTPASGGKYIELYNRAPYAIDLSHWFIRTGTYAAALPFGTMIGPTSFVVVAASQSALTNTYSELGDPANMVERYRKTGIWDWPIIFASATEYASRVVELSGFDVPSYNGTIELRDVTSNLIDRAIYSSSWPWPNSAGVALERIDPTSSDTNASAWRASTVVGTPGQLNAATDDIDSDGLSDRWEQRIVAASGGLFTNVSQVLPDDDFDGDGLSNYAEFLLGTDPVTPDADLASVAIGLAAGAVHVGFATIPVTGDAYALYKGRYYTLQSCTNLADGAWGEVPSYVGLAAGGPVTFTNATPLAFEAYRFNAELRPIRP